MDELNQAQRPIAGASYYAGGGDAYLAQRQSSVSAYNQNLRASMFRDIARPELVLLDFGCGTGGILSNLPALQKVGVEIGDRAAAEAREKGIDVHPSLADVPDASVDLAISFHAIEHVDHPLQILQELVRVLKPGARARLVVPCETPLRRAERVWRENRDQHLYTWTPLNFGNLAARAGFIDVDSRIAPMPSGSRMARTFGQRSAIGRLWSTYVNLRDNSYSVVLNAKAPMGGRR